MPIKLCIRTCYALGKKMSSFSSYLNYEKLNNGLYATLEPFEFYLNDDKNGPYVYVPEGFKFNGASIPVLIQKIFGWNPMDKRWLQATVLHDGLVNEHGQQLFIQDNKRAYVPSWNQSADWFNKALKVKTELHKCPKRYRIIFILAVKAYGIYRWIIKHQSKKILMD